MRKVAVLGWAIQPDPADTPASAYYSLDQWNELWSTTDRLLASLPKARQRDVTMPTGLRAERRRVLAAAAWHAANAAAGASPRTFGPPASFNDPAFVADIWSKRNTA
jgi:hypothetical protein